MTLTLTFADEPIVAALDDANLLTAIARFEAALALASARAGVLPVEDAGVIARVSDVRYHRELTKIFAKPTTGQRLTNIELKIVRPLRRSSRSTSGRRCPAAPR